MNINTIIENYKIFIILILILLRSEEYYFYKGEKNSSIKVALCTMGKKENLYANQFMEYYMKLGVDHIFIYDNNDPFSEKIEETMNKNYKNKISFYETKKYNIYNQAEAFTHCYNNSFKKFDFFIMVDMDEYLYIVNDTLKNYLADKIFDKCDFIKIHWANSQDNRLLHYDPRPLFQRFKKPYIKSKYIKTIIRGNITNLKYWVHSPYISPYRNITCDNEGNIINYKYMNFQSINKINTNRSYLIHFRFKSTEEFINKYKRGYSHWHRNNTFQILQDRLASYFEENGITIEKINYIEKELKLNLSSYKTKLEIINNITNHLEKIQ